MDLARPSLREGCASSASQAVSWALGGGLGLWVPTNNFTTKRASVRPHPDPRRAVPRIRNLRSVRPWGVVGGPEVDFCY